MQFNIKFYFSIKLRVASQKKQRTLLFSIPLKYHNVDTYFLNSGLRIATTQGNEIEKFHCHCLLFRIHFSAIFVSY